MQSLINIMVKKITCIRHGTALHNVMFDKIGVKAYSDYRDTPLVERGVQNRKNLVIHGMLNQKLILYLFLLHFELSILQQIYLILIRKIIFE